MILQVFTLLWLAGCGTAYFAFIRKAEPLFTGLMNFAVWLVLAFSATNIQTVTETGTVVSSAEMAVSALCIIVALISLPVVFAAASGRYSSQSTQDTLSPR